MTKQETCKLIFSFICKFCIEKKFKFDEKKNDYLYMKKELVKL